jgi:peptidoglycan/LPS O-acetylase OafA/YrhL
MSMPESAPKRSGGFFNAMFHGPAVTAEHLVYRPDIDGLRTIAVGSVVLYHAFPTLVTGGFIGVDVFFVISGYLITSIIQKQALGGTFSLAKFYERRVRRILPALLALLVAVIVVALLVSPPSDVREMAKGLAGAATFTSNIVFWKETGYFAPDAHDAPLLHTWSLAVEEQFYLTWPLLIAVVVRRRPLAWIAAIAVVSFGLSVYDVAHHPTSAFYLPQDRAWELLAGAALVFLPRIRLPAWAAQIGGLVGLACLLLPALLYTARTDFPGLAALPVCLGTALLIQIGRDQQTLANRLLSTRPFVGIGRVSYSLYLWHWPVLVYGKLLLDRPLTTPEAVVAVGLALTLAVLSWKFLEEPARTAPASTRKVLVLAVIALLATALVAVGLFVSRGLPARASEAARIADAGLRDTNPYRDRCVAGSSQSTPISNCRFGSGGPRWTIWGDSHADAVAPGLFLKDRPEIGEVREIAKHSCVPILDLTAFKTSEACHAFNRAALKALAVDKPDTLVIAGRWGVMLRPVFAEYMAKGGEPDPKVAETFRRDARRTLQAARAAVGPQTRILLIGPIPEALYSVPKCRARAEFTHQSADRLCPAISRADFDRWAGPVDAALRDAAKAADVIYLPAAPYLCDAVQCSTTQQGAPRYFDDHHLSGAGATLLIDRILKGLDSGDAPVSRPEPAPKD